MTVMCFHLSVTTADMRTPLQVLVRDRLQELGLTYQQAARRSRGRVKAHTFTQLAARRPYHGGFSDNAVIGLAAALKLPETKIRAIAEPSKPRGPVRIPPPEYRNPLHRLVVERMIEKKIGVRKVAAASGGRISSSTVARIANGSTVHLKVLTLDGLAAGLELPREVVHAAAGMEVDEIFHRFHELSPEQRDHITGLIRGWLAEIDGKQSVSTSSRSTS